MKELFWGLLLLPLLIGGCGSADNAAIPAVSDFPISSYMGKWFEIARLPNWFEENMADVTAEYTLLPDQTIRVVNAGYKNGRYREISGRARCVKADNSGELEVAFAWWGFSPYRVIKLAQDVSWSIVAGKNSDYLWIMARTPQLPQPLLDELVSWCRKQGFPVEKLIFPQTGTGKLDKKLSL